VLGEELAQLFNSLTFFRLSGNPLHCNCELRWFSRWLTSDAQAPAKVLDIADVLCVSPSTLTGLSVCLSVSCRSIGRLTYTGWSKINEATMFDCSYLQNV